MSSLVRSARLLLVVGNNRSDLKHMLVSKEEKQNTKQECLNEVIADYKMQQNIMQAL